MRLRDTFATDLATFINTDEFAELRTIDGVAGIPCILEDAVDNGQLGAGDPNIVSGAELYVDASLLLRRPQINRTIVIDGTEYMVSDVAAEEGMLRVALSKHGSY